MHYYQFNIGDYASHTKSLSLIEDLAFRRILDEYYLHEQPLNGCPTDVARSIGMREHEEEVYFILNKFFYLDGDCWRQKRIDREIKAYHKNKELKAKAGKASAKARKSKPSEHVLNTCLTEDQQKATGVGKQEPINKNHKPRTKKDNSAAAHDFLREWFADFWDSWPDGYGEKGSRKNAETAYLKIKPDLGLSDRMKSAVQDQWQAKNQTSLAGGFVSNFKHVERWLKGKEWETVIDQSAPRNSIIENMQDRSWSE